MSVKIFTLVVYSVRKVVKSVSKNRSNFPSIALKYLESVRKVVKSKRSLCKLNAQLVKW